MSKSKLNGIIKGEELQQEISKKSVGLQLYDNLKKTNPSKILFVNGFTDETKTCGQFLKNTCLLAESLTNFGLIKNDVISICSENNLYFFEPAVAAMYQGICVAPINNNYTERELLHVINISKPKVVFCSNNTYKKFLSLIEEVKFIRKLIVFDLNGFPKSDGIVQNYEDFIKDNVNILRFDVQKFTPIDLDTYNDLAVILCSSGTTGLPKGVMITHRNINMRHTHLGDSRFHKFTSEACILALLPFFHGYGFITNLGNITKTYKMIVVDRFVDKVFLKCIEKYKITNLWLVPPLVIFLAKHPMVTEYDLSSVIEIISGAAPLGKDVQESLKTRLKIDRIIQGYGLTETTLAVLQIPIQSKIKPGSSGIVVPGITIKLRNPETGSLLGPNKVGEICVKGDLVMKGYYENEESTKSTFDKDGWLLTGDLGYYDEDGYFYIVDRIKELIKYKGFQVPPAELEALLLTHPKIKDVGVVGLPDEDAGELPLAFVVKQTGCSVGEEEIKKYVADQLSSPKHLRGGVRFIQEIPKNASGKILRRVLKEMVTKQKSKL